MSIGEARYLVTTKNGQIIILGGSASASKAQPSKKRQKYTDKYLIESVSESDQVYVYLTPSLKGKVHIDQGCHGATVKRDYHKLVNEAKKNGNSPPVLCARCRSSREETLDGKK